MATKTKETSKQIIPLTVETLVLFINKARDVHTKTQSGTAASFVKKMHVEIIPMWEKIEIQRKANKIK